MARKTTKTTEAAAAKAEETKVASKPDTEGAEDSSNGDVPTGTVAPSEAQDVQDAALAPAGEGQASPAPNANAEAEGSAAPQAGGAEDQQLLQVAPPLPASDDETTADPDDATGKDMEAMEAQPTVTVTCLRPGGRRRAGRRWPQGETIIAAADLTDFHLAQLEGDPLFSIRKD